VNTNTWTEYSQNITADTTWNTAQFIFSIRNTNATGGHLKIDSAVVFIPAPTGPTSIYDIQYTTDAAGESPLIGQQVQTGGIVSAVYASGYFIQDGVGLFYSGWCWSLERFTCFRFKQLPGNWRLC